MRFRYFLTLFLFSSSALVGQPYSVLDADKALGSDVAQIIRASETVYAQRLHIVRKDQEGGGFTYTVQIDPEKIYIPKSERISLKSFLTDKKYLTDGLKDCGFLPGVKYVFIQGEKKASVVVCFTCSEIKSYLGDDKIEHCAFDPGYPLLIDITYKIFPKDKEFGKLKKKLEPGH